MRIVEACHKSLNARGYVTTSRNIKRAYWRYAKRRGGFDVGLENQVYTITEYLLINKQARPAYKYQKV